MKDKLKQEIKLEFQYIKDSLAQDVKELEEEALA